MTFQYHSPAHRAHIERKLQKHFQAMRAKRQHLTGIAAAKAWHEESQEIGKITATMMGYFPTIGNYDQTW